MNIKFQKIEIDSQTAEELKARAADRGISVSELLADLIRESGPVAADADEIAELDRRWAAVERGGATISHEKVVRWLQTWGTPAFRPWRDQ
jgi:hypothetical protein